jgi:hypothetical protein
MSLDEFGDSDEGDGMGIALDHAGAGERRGGLDGKGKKEGERWECRVGDGISGCHNRWGRRGRVESPVKPEEPERQGANEQSGTKERM